MERWAGPERIRISGKRTHIWVQSRKSCALANSKACYTRQGKKCKEREEMLRGEARVREGETRLCFH